MCEIAEKRCSSWKANLREKRNEKNVNSLERPSTHVDFDANIFACAPKRIGRSRDAIVGKRDLFSNADRSDRSGRDSSIAEDDTLFLRLLGRGTVQVDAVNELTALRSDHPYRGETLHHISRLQINLKLRQNKTKDLQEVIMNLALAYDKWLEETLAKGRMEGRVETQIDIARRML